MVLKIDQHSYKQKTNYFQNNPFQKSKDWKQRFVLPLHSKFEK